MPSRAEPHRRLWSIAAGLILAMLAGLSVAAQAPPADHAVVLVYHHVDASTPASTSVTPDRFAEHLEWLADNGYRVMSLNDLLEPLRAGEMVPDKAVAITFDDAWVSVHDTAAPMLAERGWPFAVFVNTGAVDAGEGPVMSWDQIRSVVEMGGAIESHSAGHAHLPARADGETDREWAARIEADLARSADRIEEEVGQRPTVFAYPYGEDSADLARLVETQYEFGLVQRSGAVGHSTDFLAVPRFPMATGFDGPDRFERAVRSRPLPIERANAVPPGPGVRGEAMDAVELRLGAGDFRADQLSCFSSGGEPLTLHRPADTTDRIVRITTRSLDRPGRNKINCTAPAGDGSGDWYWYSYQWLRPPLE